MTPTRRANRGIGATAPPPLNPFIPCPSCQSVGELTRVCSGVGVSRDISGHLETTETGARFSCQRCGHLFHIGPTGIYVPHPQSLPPPMRMPAMPAQVQPSQPFPAPPLETGEEPRPARPIREPQPTPRERPAP